MSAAIDSEEAMACGDRLLVVLKERKEKKW
jgi:hypothetical protein